MNDAGFAPQVELSRVRVRLICVDERGRWDALMRAHHYLGLTTTVGRTALRSRDRWALCWASPALKCASRDTWIGWSPTLQWQRLGLIANNSRFLILPGVRVKNLASRGFIKSNRTYVEHGATKRIWVYPFLHRQAALILSQPLPHPELPRLEIKMMTLTDADAATLFSRLDNIEDPLARRGRRHDQRSVLATILCAVVSGAQGSATIGEWVQRLRPPMLRRLRCRHTAEGRYEPPSEPTIRRILAAVNIEQLERQLGDWLQAHTTGNEPIAACRQNPARFSR